MDLRLELVPVPVGDVDRAKDFYVDKLGFNEDHDVRPADGLRVVQLTPPGSACSILLSAGLPLVEMQPGSVRGLHLVVDDIAESREALAAGGVELGELDDLGGMQDAGFTDPDGNTSTLQEISGAA